MSHLAQQCMAILEQGVQKGNQCNRPKLENGFCGKHQKQALLLKINKDTEKKCTTHRCNTIIPSTDKYCNICQENKKEKLKAITLCKGIENKPCNFEANESGYCGKHQARGLLLEEAKELSVRICDDGKRACKNITVDNKLHCESCLEKYRKQDKERYDVKAESCNLCLDCGVKLESLHVGIKGHSVQRCEECYQKLRSIEEKRVNRERNYAEEKKNKIEQYLHSYNVNAQHRNLSFKLNIDEFKDYVTSACYYCGYYNESEVIGIDRIDSNRGYSCDNCVPCCQKCNIMKNTLHKDEFLEHITKIYKHIYKAEDVNIDALLNNKKTNNIVKKDEVIELSRIRPHKIADMYVKGQIQTFIDNCKKDNRSPSFIEKIEAVKNNKLPHREFATYLRTALRADAKTTTYYNSNEQQRVSHNNLYRLLDYGNVSHAIILYESVHGDMPGFSEDMEELSNAWKTCSEEERRSNLHKLLVKYQNQRAKSKYQT
jgi:hypothetical protein